MLEGLKLFLKQRLPRVHGLLGSRVIRENRFVAHWRVAGKSTETIFRDVFLNNRWGDEESASGSGSNLGQTAIIRQELPHLLEELHAKSLLDIPCGDFHWMSQLALPVEKYYGADVVPEIIDLVRSRYPDRAENFQVLNLLSDPLPRAEVIFCRDCLVHLSFEDVAQALANIKRSGAEYLLTTTFTAQKSNGDIPTGLWRPLNLQLAPFHFPSPLKVVCEGCTEGKNSFPDKSLGVWRVSDIPDRLNKS